jgi:hypothetical protein
LVYKGLMPELYGITKKASIPPYNAHNK